MGSERFKSRKQFSGKILITLLLLFAVLVLSSVSASAGGEAYIPGEYIIQYQDGTIGIHSAFSAFSSLPTEVLLEYNATIENLSHKGLALISFDEPLSADEEKCFIDDLMSSPKVKHVEKNREVTLFYDPNSYTYDDPLSAEQWGTSSVRAFEAWRMLPENTGTVRVAVIDTGVDSTHPDLAGQVLNGYNTMDVNSYGQRYSETDASDDHGHGTHVTGIITATCDNGVGIQGVSGTVDVEILPIKALNDAGRGSTYNVVNAIYYAADYGADIINLSLGSSYPSDLEREAVNYALNKNCLIIAAAGNDSTNVSTQYPASYDGVIAVASVDRDESRSYFSNYGNGLDLSAPGGNIISTIPKAIAMSEMAGGKTVYGNDIDGYYVSWSGTSMAAPHVVGVAALYKAVNPSARNFEIGNHLVNTARDVGPIGKDLDTGAGIVDAAATLGSDIIRTSVILMSPDRGAELYETVNLKVQVNTSPEMEISQVRFYLDDISGDSIANIDCDGEGSYYDYQFDTKTVEDGNYELIAVAYNSLGEIVGEPAKTTVTILNYIKNGFTLNVSTPDNTAGGNAEITIFGIDANGDYKRLKNAYASSLGYARIKGLAVYDEYLILTKGNYDSTYFVYQQVIPKTLLGSTISVDGSHSTLGDFSMRNKDSVDLTNPYLMVAPAYLDANGKEHLLTTYSAWKVSKDAKIYFDKGLYGLFIYWTPSLDPEHDQKDSSFYLSKWAEVKEDENDLHFDYRKAVLVKPIYQEGISGSFRLEQIPGESVIPFFSGMITGNDIYITPGSYKASVELRAQRGGNTWMLQLEKPVAVEAVTPGTVVEIPFGFSMRIEEFYPNAGVKEEDGAYVMYRGQMMRTKNTFIEENGNIIKGLTDNYPTFRIYRLEGESKVLVFEENTRYLSDASHWHSSSDFIGSIPPGPGKYSAELTFDPSPFGSVATKSFAFELRNKDGVNKQGIQLNMGEYYLPRATVDIYSFSNGAWIKSYTTPPGDASSEDTGYMEIPTNITLSSEGLNLAVVKYTARKIGYGLADPYVGFRTVPFSDLSELETIDISPIDSVSFKAFDDSGNRVDTRIYLPFYSDADGLLAKPVFVDHIALNIKKSYGGDVLHIPLQSYDYAYATFNSALQNYYLVEKDMQLQAGDQIDFDGRESHLLSIVLPAGWETRSFSPGFDGAKGDVSYHAPQINSYRLLPGAYQPVINITNESTGRLLSLKAGQAMELTSAKSLEVGGQFIPHITLDQNTIDLDQDLKGKITFTDNLGNELLATAKKINFDYVYYDPELILVNPNGEEITLPADYLNIDVSADTFVGEGLYSLYLKYDLGYGIQHTEKISFSLGSEEQNRITVRPDSRYSCQVNDPDSISLTIYEGVRGFNRITAEVLPGPEDTQVTFSQVRDGITVSSVSLRRVFREGSNSVTCGFNVRSGDVIIINRNE